MRRTGGALRVIYIHGFGGRSFDHSHAAVMRDVARDLYGGFAVETHPWQSGRISASVGREWREANRDAAAEAERLWTRLCAEPADQRVYLVGFSLGSLVALRAVQGRGAEAEARVSGICLMGAAVPASYSFAGFPRLRRGVLNYYSPTIDGTLKRLFTVEEGLQAAGQVGFHEGFEGGPAVNLRVHKAHKLFGGYDQVARVIAQIVAHWEGKAGPRGLRHQEKEDDWRGEVFWDEVYRRGPLLVQRWRVGLRWGGFRLVERHGASVRRIVTSDHVGPLLEQLDRLYQAPA